MEDEAGVRDFIAVNAEAYGTYGMPAEVVSDLFDEPKRLLEDPARTSWWPPGAPNPSPRP